jgi:hypothetical protein
MPGFYQEADRPRKTNVWLSGCQAVIMVGAALALLAICCGIAIQTWRT